MSKLIKTKRDLPLSACLMKKLSASGESMEGWASAIIAQNYLSREDIIFRSWLCFTVLTVTNHGIDELFTIKKTAGLKKQN